MFARYIVFILCLLSVSAHAGSRAICDQLLSSSSLTSVEGSAKDLSPSAQVYVSLIQFYINNSNDESSKQILSIVLNSDVFLNPFAGIKKSLENQIAPAIEKLRSQDVADEWFGIQTALKKLSQKAQAENQDRARKEDSTSVLFAPKVVNAEEHNSVFESTPSWQTVDNRVFVAVGNDDMLFVYELIKGQLKELSFTQISGKIRSTPSWQVVDGQAYIAIGSDNNHLYLYQLEGKKLRRRASHNTYAIITATPAWQIVKNRVFVAVSNYNDGLFLYELLNNTLVSRGRVTTGGSNRSPNIYTRGAPSPSWQIVGDRAFVAVGSNDGHLYLYELVGDELQEQGRQKTNGYIHSASSWQVVDERVFVAVASGDPSHLNLYELIDGKLKERGQSQAQVDGIVYSSPSWQKVDDQTLITIGSTDGHLYLYTLADYELKFLGQTKIDDDIRSFPSWQKVGEQVYIAVGGASGLHFLELSENNLVPIGHESVVKDWLGTATWQVINDEAFVAVGSVGKEFYLIKVFKKLKKGGRK